MSQNYPLYEEQSTDVFLVIYYTLTELFKKLERYLLKRIVKWSCLGAVKCVSVVADDWIVDHRRLFLSSQVLVTWLLIAYRSYRRYIKSQQTDTNSRPEEQIQAADNDAIQLAIKDELELDTATEGTDDFRRSFETENKINVKFVNECEYNSFVSSTECSDDQSTEVSSANILNELNQRKAEDRFSQSSISTFKRKGFVGEVSMSIEDFNDEQITCYPKTDKQRIMLIQSVKTSVLFHSLDDSQLRKIIDAMMMRHVNKGDVVIQQGDDGDFFYVVGSGVYEATVENEDGSIMVVKTYQESGSFGELALINNAPRAATVTCLKSGHLWALDRKTFAILVVKMAQQKRGRYERIISTIPILSRLTSDERANVIDAIVQKNFPSGSPIIKQGDIGDGMYFLLCGEAQVMYTDQNGVEKYIKTLHPGDYFGELALVTENPRASTVYARGNVETGFIDKEAFERLLGPCKEIMKRNIDLYQEEISKLLDIHEAVIKGAAT